MNSIIPVFVNCIYSDLLISRIHTINQSMTMGEQIDVEKIKKSVAWAKFYHGQQKRQSGEPYYSHPIMVAEMVARYVPKTNIIITSILHDTLEDTDLTFDQIAENFNITIATQVQDLTRTYVNGKKISSAELIESLWLQKKYEVLLVKQFDRLHNIQTLHAKSPEKIRKIAHETLDCFVVLAAYLGIRDIENELVELCSAFNKQMD